MYATFMEYLFYVCGFAEILSEFLKQFKFLFGGLFVGLNLFSSFSCLYFMSCYDEDNVTPEITTNNIYGEE